MTNQKLELGPWSSTNCGLDTNSSCIRCRKKRGSPSLKIVETLFNFLHMEVSILGCFGVLTIFTAHKSLIRCGFCDRARIGKPENCLLYFSKILSVGAQMGGGPHLNVCVFLAFLCCFLCQSIRTQLQFCPVKSWNQRDSFQFWKCWTKIFAALRISDCLKPSTWPGTKDHRLIFQSLNSFLPGLSTWLHTSESPTLPTW